MCFISHRNLNIKRNKAFTLIEFAAGLMIIALVYMIVSPAIIKMQDDAKSAIAENELKEIETGIDDFLKENGRYPDTLEEAFGETPLDEWGNPYQYLNMANVVGNGQKRKDKNLVPINSDYDLYSMGPDGKTASALTAAISRDDIVRGRNGAFFGLASEY